MEDFSGGTLLGAVAIPEEMQREGGEVVLCVCVLQSSGCSSPAAAPGTAAVLGRSGRRGCTSSRGVLSCGENSRVYCQERELISCWRGCSAGVSQNTVWGDARLYEILRCYILFPTEMVPN